MTVDVPRKRTLGVLLLIGAAAGLGAGLLDSARGVPSTSDSFFPGSMRPPQPGIPAAAPDVSTGGAAAFLESTAK